MRLLKKPHTKIKDLLRGRQPGFATVIIILIVIIVIVAGGAGYYFYKTSKVPQKEAEEVKHEEIPEKVPEEIPDETADWQVYKNEAIFLKDALICQKIQTERYRNDCYAEVAKVSKDISVCDEIKNIKLRSYCYQWVNPSQPELPTAPVSEWKTYVNEKHKYSFKHPPKWDFKVDLTNPETSELFVIRERISNEPEWPAEYEWLWNVVIETWDNPQNLILKDWLSVIKGIPQDAPRTANTFVGEEKIEALKLWQGGTSTWDKPGKPIMSYPYLEVYFVYKDKGYRAKLSYQDEVDEESQEVFSQILSTFKFGEVLEEDEIVQISVAIDMESFDLENKTFEGWIRTGERTKVKVITTDSTEFYRISEPTWEKEYSTFSEFYSDPPRNWPLMIKGIFEEEDIIKADEVFIILQ